MNNGLFSYQYFANNLELERKKLQEVWEKTVVQKRQDLDNKNIRSATLDSWSRCMRQGVDPIQTTAPIISCDVQVKEAFSHSKLYRYLVPYIESLTGMVNETNSLFVVTSSKGEIAHIEGNFSLRSKAEQMNFVLGSSWAERDTGTNAIGAVVATKLPHQIFAAEHFCQRVHDWSCAAAPIKDPATDNVLGIVNLTGQWRDLHPYAISMVSTLVRAIENDLGRDVEVNRFKLLARYSEVATGSPNVYVAAVDLRGRVLKADPLLYEKKWVAENHMLKDVQIKTNLELKEESWEVQREDGRWRVFSIPYIDQRQPVGCIVYIVPPNSQLSNSNSTKYSFNSMIGHSNAFVASMKDAMAASGTDLPVLIEGESGTGKELVAQSIHQASSRANNPFIAVNCGALPKELGISELFGFEGGTFTGAAKNGRIGKFEQAQGGTIFLDEIGEMPLDMQTYLLRVLEENEVVVLGGKKAKPLDVRVIAATNRNLITAVQEGKFRQDLFYRLNILCIKVPPLRKRPEDIPLLLDFYLKKACKELRRTSIEINKSALRVLQLYGWPGNVRELRNIVYRMVTNSTGSLIEASEIPIEIRETLIHDVSYLDKSKKETPLQQKNQTVPFEREPDIVDEPTIKDTELKMILKELNKQQGNVTKAARRLGIHRSTIYRKLRFLQMSERFDK
ncbi:sigma54 specific transcriptional regulator [Halalkalibacter wakoensis JCM 9140]|uniref:Sigma54 specific transcriptional regulator n=1 Tax=Halalkalibacter wakoensis JCM 9140 TaxID=1236970 RepID=W4QAW9_9BACI|nr:sigma-54-dependent Fis family transcriptional regulator [Halalkalibacter wakoensis]GAE28514.1 sigma54 specific transcriptional regulator [Halalkalibacter wakoensis JCM 9140]